MTVYTNVYIYDLLSRELGKQNMYSPRTRIDDEKKVFAKKRHSEWKTSDGKEITPANIRGKNQSLVRNRTTVTCHSPSANGPAASPEINVDSFRGRRTTFLKYRIRSRPVRRRPENPVPKRSPTIRPDRTRGEPTLSDERP